MWVAPGQGVYQLLLSQKRPILLFLIFLSFFPYANSYVIFPPHVLSPFGFLLFRLVLCCHRLSFTSANLWILPSLLMPPLYEDSGVLATSGLSWLNKFVIIKQYVKFSTCLGMFWVHVWGIFYRWCDVPDVDLTGNFSLACNFWWLLICENRFLLSHFRILSLHPCTFFNVIFVILHIAFNKPNFNNPYNNPGS